MGVSVGGHSRANISHMFYIRMVYVWYEIDQCKKLYTLSDFENEKPTFIDANHAFWESEPKFQNLIPKNWTKSWILPESA